MERELYVSRAKEDVYRRQIKELEAALAEVWERKRRSLKRLLFFSGCFALRSLTALHRLSILDASEASLAPVNGEWTPTVSSRCIR